MALCTFSLLKLSTNIHRVEFARDLLSKDKGDEPSILVVGIPHGWVHRPLNQDKERLEACEWDLFVFAKATSNALTQCTEAFTNSVGANVLVPQEQFDNLVTERLHGVSRTPPKLPEAWYESNQLKLPPALYAEAWAGPPMPGMLRLDSAMAEFLSSALPRDIRETPVSLFNLFKYPNADPSIHNQYMRDFADNFGDSAGAYVKFMGPFEERLRIERTGTDSGKSEGGVWHDADLVHYDSIYHYAYMLSTGVYQRLNKDKMDGLEDTCILMISEVEVRE